MKKRIAYISAIVLLVSMCTTAFASTYFSDVPSGSEFAKYIDHLAEKNIVSGSGGMYYPENNLSRGELTKIAVLSANMTLNTTGGQYFSDVPVTSPFYQYIQTAYNAEVISGFSDGTFRPDDSVTRGAGAKIIVNSFNYAETLTGAPHFNDVPASHNFYNYIETAFNRGLIGGYGNGKFGPDDNIKRNQMAKIISLALGGPTTPQAVTGDVVLNYSQTGIPSGTASIFSTTQNKVSFDFMNLDSLDGSYMYQAWLKVGSEYEKLGSQFDMNSNGDPADKQGARITNAFSADSNIEDGSEIIITLENAIYDQPEGATILRGNVDNDLTVYLNFPGDLPSQSAAMSVTGKNVTYKFSSLPNLGAYGFHYEGWFLINDSYVSTGTFQGTNGSTSDNFTYLEEPGSDIQKVVISVEPVSDTSAQQFQITPYMSKVDPFSTGDSTDDEDDTTGNEIPSVDGYDVYDGLTTDQTSMSIVYRTVMEVDEDEDVIIEGYSAAEKIPDNGFNAIIFKVSDTDGNPYGGLEFVATQLSGQQGTLDDPQEMGNDTGIYLAAYQADTGSSISTSSEEVIISIAQDDRDDEDPVVPAIEVTFEQTRSTILGSPKTMEVDIPQDAVVWDDNLNSSDQQDTLIVLSIIHDNKGAVIDDLRSDMQLLTVGGSDIDTTPSEEGGIYIFEVDVEKIIDDDANITVTYSAEAQVQLLTTSSGLYIPIISDQFEITAQFIPQED